MIFYLNDRCKKIHFLVFKHYTLQTNETITANGCILDKFGRRTVFAVIISFLACHILQAYLGKLCTFHWGLNCLLQFTKLTIFNCQGAQWLRTLDQGVASSSITRGTVLCP